MDHVFSFFSFVCLFVYASPYLVSLEGVLHFFPSPVAINVQVSSRSEGCPSHNCCCLSKKKSICQAFCPLSLSLSLSIQAPNAFVNIHKPNVTLSHVTLEVLAFEHFFSSSPCPALFSFELMNPLSALQPNLTCEVFGHCFTRLFVPFLLLDFGIEKEREGLGTNQRVWIPRFQPLASVVVSPVHQIDPSLPLLPEPNHQATSVRALLSNLGKPSLASNGMLSQLQDMGQVV